MGYWTDTQCRTKKGVENENSYMYRGCLDETKVSCSFFDRGAELILVYSWARPAVLAAGKGRGGMLLFLLFLPFLLFSFFFPIALFHLWETTQNDPQGLMCR